MDRLYKADPEHVQIVDDHKHLDKVAESDIIDEAEVVALCDTNKNSIDQSLSTLEGGAETFSDLDNLIDANLVDAYIIATPNFTHIDVLKKIIKTNAHLLIEKPLCTNVKDCKEFAKLKAGA